MKRSVRLGLPAICSLAINGLLLIGLLQLGIGQQRSRQDQPSLTVMSLAVPLGVEDAPEDRQVEQQQPAQPTTPDPPPIPSPDIASAPSLPLPVMRPTAPSVASAPPAPTPEPAVAAASAAAQPATAAGATLSAPRKGAADGLKANAPAGNSRSYAAKVRSWLYAHKTYPRRSRMRREEGVVRVRFVLDRQGQLLEGQVIGKSGFAALDEEGQAMLSRASPYPAAPQDILGSRIEFTVPIEWQLPA
ncbi:energy transducer TonB [Sphingomonas sp. So64.6b]|uniref:energy transducer TonB n=1 Tax=Sphingomonas sp. So64.6b TaxID=2997354 RepID=UPI001600B04E|nr:energy transducer TonB [Sphingomonas sp. So64.6b]QNA85575.1 energy transducer TonB [Sphingomonas sp. So64.6b]